jgi:hypothetical protein
MRGNETDTNGRYGAVSGSPLCRPPACVVPRGAGRFTRRPACSLYLRVAAPAVATLDPSPLSFRIEMATASV